MIKQWIVGMTIIILGLMAFFPLHVHAGAGICQGQPGGSFVQDKGVLQGWLVPYSGGAPCKTKEPSSQEIVLISSQCCSGSTEGCLTVETITKMAKDYPTCQMKNLVVKRNSLGKLEAFDNEPTPDKTTQVTVSGKNTITPTQAVSGKMADSQNIFVRIWQQLVQFIIKTLSR